MSQMMISPTPAPPPNTAGSANAVSQSDATGQPGASAKTTSENGAASPFATVLKTQVDKKAAADTANSTSSSAAVTKTNAEDQKTTNVDLSALLPLLAANQGGPTYSATAPATKTTGPSPDEKLLLGLQSATEQAPAQTLTALPTVALPTVALPAAAQATEALPTATTPSAALPAVALPSAFTAVMDRTPRKQDVEIKDQTFTSAGSTKSGETSQTPGKIGPDAAITADVGNKSAEKNAPELPANDFQSLMERAAAMMPATANLAKGSSSGPSLRIDTPLGQTGWHDEVGQKLTWMVGNNRQQADLVLNPPHLGRVEVSLTMNGDQATAIFTSSNPAVRETLESSLHRLREVLADAGVSLGQAQVGSESPNQSSPRNELDFGRNEGVRYASTISLPSVNTVTRTGGGRSMIDIFA
jgi:flagellar hook-length control protein FliK